MKTLQELFSTFETDAFRLEGLSAYSVPEEKEAREHFEQYGQLPKGFNSDWGQLIRSSAGARKTFRRLRLLSRKLSSYEEFEIAAYGAGIAAGEQIRAASRSDLNFENDFWLFDSTWLATMKYDADGRWHGADVTKIALDQRADISQWIELFQRAKPIDEYLT